MTPRKRICCAVETCTLGKVCNWNTVDDSVLDCCVQNQTHEQLANPSSPVRLAHDHCVAIACIPRSISMKYDNANDNGLYATALYCTDFLSCRFLYDIVLSRAHVCTYVLHCAVYAEYVCVCMCVHVSDMFRVACALSLRVSRMMERVSVKLW